jgi:penicillin-binding protein 1C
VRVYEDKRFYYHLGFDIFSIARAAWQNIKSLSIVSGGSTISMQVIRLSRDNPPRTFTEKIIEIILAFRMELTYSKKRILKLYASNAPYGGNIIGLETAAWRYFGSEPQKLSWAESALLAVLPNSPSLIHLGKNRVKLLKKRNRLLKQLLDEEIIDSAIYQLSLEEEIPEKPKDFPHFAPHLLDRVKLEHEFDFRVKTTLDIELQKQIIEITNRHAKIHKANQINNIAALVLDVKTGNVLAYVGNLTDLYDQENASQVDVIMGDRSTGSILKPLLYASMLTEGFALPKMLFPDIPTYINGYMPQNYKLDHDGAVPADRALARSLNVPAVLMLQKYGVEKFHFKLKKLGLSSLTQNPDYYGLSLILGGCEGKLWDLTGIYASMARVLNNYSVNNGFYNSMDIHAPNYLKNNQIEQERGKEKSSILSAAAIWATFEAMVYVERPDNESNWDLFASNRRISWKTGTSFGFRDAWAIGVTPEYAVGVWLGNADGEGRPDLVGIQAAAPVLFDIFDKLPENLPKFEVPYDEMYKAAICHESGHLASEFCTNIDSAWIPNTGMRTEACPYHKLVHLDFTGQWQVTSDCESVNNMQNVSWFVLPPAMEWYYKSKNVNYKILPHFREDCKDAKFGKNGSMQVIYPKHNSQMFIPKEIDGKKGNAIFEAAHRIAGTKIYWHIDNKFVMETTDFHKISVAPTVGKHILTLIDENGEELKINFEIIVK